MTLDHILIPKPDSYTYIISIHFNIPKKWKSVDINFVTSLANHKRREIFLFKLIMIAIQVCCIWKFYRTYRLNKGSMDSPRFNQSGSSVFGSSLDPWPVYKSVLTLFSFSNCFLSLSSLATHLKIYQNLENRGKNFWKFWKFWFWIIRQFDNEWGVSNWRTWIEIGDADFWINDPF